MSGAVLSVEELGVRISGRQVLDHVNFAIEAGEFEASSKMTFGDLLDRYFDARKGRLEETTLALYRRTINQHVRPKIGNVRLDKLTREHVERILDDARDCSMRKRNSAPPCKCPRHLPHYSRQSRRRCH